MGLIFRILLQAQHRGSPCYRAWGNPQIRQRFFQNHHRTGQELSSLFWHYFQCDVGGSVFIIEKPPPCALKEPVDSYPCFCFFFHKIVSKSERKWVCPSAKCPGSFNVKRHGYLPFSLEFPYSASGSWTSIWSAGIFTTLPSRQITKGKNLTKLNKNNESRQQYRYKKNVLS